MPTGSPPTSNSGFPVTGLCMPAGLAISGDYVYTHYIVDNAGQQLWALKINKNDGTYTEYQLFGNDTVFALTVDATYLYMSRAGGQLQISKRFLTDLTTAGDCVYEAWGTGVYIDDGQGGNTELMATPAPSEGIVILGGYIYATHYSDGYNTGGVISRIDATALTLDTGFGPNGYWRPGSLSNPKGLATDGTYLYIANAGANNILRMNADGNGIVAIKEGISGLKGLTFSGGYLYATLSSTVVKIQVSDPANMITIVSSGLYVPLELAVSGSYIYVANTSNSQRSNFPITMTGFIGRYGDSGGGGAACFKEGTKILTNNGYVPVQDLKEGDLIQTLKHGFKPIHLVGKAPFVHNIGHRATDRLYKCCKDQYPEIFEDLIITGLHSILVNSFKEDEKEQVTKLFGKIFVTDNKYRLPVLLDNRASIYENEGMHTIYHIALEHENECINYGIYANGLLVESSSIKELKEFF